MEASFGPKRTGGKMANTNLQLPPISSCPKVDTKKHATENPFAWPSDSVFQRRLKKEVEEKDHNEGSNFSKNTLLGPLAKTQPCVEREKTQLGSEFQFPDLMGNYSAGYRTKHDTSRELINQQRKMFREQLVINSKQDTIQHMQTTLSREKTKLSDTKRRLEEEAVAFEDLMKQVERHGDEIMKMADLETKARLKTEAEVRKVYSEIVAIKSDIAKNEDILKEYKEYADFLYMISPPEWREAQEQKREEREAARKIEEEKDLGRSKMQPMPSSNSGSRASRGNLVEDSIQLTKDSDEELELYFTDPQQLIHILKELEEDNIHLLQNLQEEEEHLQNIIQRGNIAKDKMEKHLESVRKSKEVLVNKLTKEKEILADLELKIKMFSFGDLTASDMDKLLSKLTKLIADVYASCVGGIQTRIDPLQMLESIENVIIDLEEKLEAAPRDIVHSVKKEKAKDMRKRVREEKLRQQEINRAARLFRSMERANANIPKIVGRKLMKRSEPPTKSNKTNTDISVSVLSEQEDFYFK